MLAEKTCSKCGALKAASEFYVDRWRQDGRNPKLRSCCKTCDARRANSYQAIRLARNPGARYGMSADRYWAMFEQQNGLCASCRQPESYLLKSGEPRRLSVDHDHTCCPGRKACGRCVRGLLCCACNQALGLLGDDRSRIESLLTYITT